MWFIILIILVVVIIVVVNHFMKKAEAERKAQEQAERQRKAKADLENRKRIYEKFTEKEKQKLKNISEEKFAAMLNAYPSAQKGDAKAMLLVAMTYDLDLKISEKAFYWMEKSSKAGNLDAKYFLGTYYGDGYGIKENRTKGIGLILEAAKGGNKNAIDFCKNKLEMPIEEMRRIGIPV